MHLQYAEWVYSEYFSKGTIFVVFVVEIFTHETVTAYLNDPRSRVYTVARTRQKTCELKPYTHVEQVRVYTALAVAPSTALFQERKQLT